MENRGRKPENGQGPRAGITADCRCPFVPIHNRKIVPSSGLLYVLVPNNSITAVNSWMESLFSVLSGRVLCASCVGCVHSAY